MEFDDEFFECRIYSAFWEGEPPGEPKLSARCGVQLLKAEKFLGSARALPSRKTIANRQLLFAIRHSLLAVVLARQEPCPLNTFRHPSLVPRPSSR
jgi:hypothetical protein